jgi:hypothetical protein
VAGIGPVEKGVVKIGPADFRPITPTPFVGVGFFSIPRPAGTF